jgi:hypothetical protein
MEEKAIPIKTPIGTFENYRDGIILKNIEWKHPQVIFYCNISNHAIKINGDNKVLKEYNFKIIFEGVISLFHAEYDTYEAIYRGFPKSGANESIFEIIENSNYIKNLPIRNEYKNKVNHYCLTTYDDVFDIIAKSYAIEVL